MIGAAVSAAAAPRPRAATRSGEAGDWIVSPAVDVLLFVGSAVTTLLPWLMVDKLRYPAFYALAAVAIISNGPHLVSTWTRVYLPRRERFRRPLHYWLAPGLLAAFAVACVAIEGAQSAVLRTVVFYYATYHFTAQNYGILRIYQRKHGLVTAAGPSRLATLEKSLVFLIALYFLSRRIFTGPWEVFYGPVYYIRPRAWMVNALGMGILTLVAAYVAVLVTQRPTLAQLQRPLFIASTALGFAVPFALIKDGTAAFAAAACWHGLQYLGIVWLYNRRRYSGRSDPDARLLAWVSQPGRMVAYFALMWGLAGVVYGLVYLASLVAIDFGTASLLAWTSLTLGHYYLDGVIWKFKQYDLDQQLVRGAA